MSRGDPGTGSALPGPMIRNRHLAVLALAATALLSTPGSARADEPVSYPGTSLSGTTDLRHGGHGRAPGFTRRTDFLVSADDRPWAEEAGVSLVDEERSAVAGIAAGPFREGRVTLARGEHGEVDLDAGRLWARGAAGAGIGPSGLLGRAHADGSATLVGLFAGTKVYGLGDPRGPLYANGGGFAVAFVGAEANADLQVRAGHRGAAARARVGGFAGAKALSVALGSTTFCGVALNARGGASVSAGIGGEAGGHARFDWATMTASIGADASATLGLGAGLGGEVEISLEGALRDPRKAAGCVAEAANAVAAAVNGKLARALCLFCEEPSASTPGTAAGRGEPTRAAAPSRGRTGAADPGAGVTR